MDESFTAMKQKQGNIARWVPPWLVIACLVLVLASAAAQALHSHPDGLEKNARHCPVCPLLHSPVRMAGSCHASVTFQPAGFLSPLLETDRKTDLHSSPYSSRPPPSA
jgi:hypothetical protein